MEKDPLKRFKEEVNYFEQYFLKLENKAKENRLEYPFFNQSIREIVHLKHIVEYLKKIDKNTTEEDNIVKSFRERLDRFNQDTNNEYYQLAIKRLDRLVGEQKKYCYGFRSWRKLVKTDNAGHLYIPRDFRILDERPYWIDDEEWENIFGERTEIQNLLEYFEGEYDFKEYINILKKVDEVIKPMIYEIIEYFEIPEEVIYNFPEAPEKYWWLHLKKPDNKLSDK
jgi:hypothetical protein